MARCAACIGVLAIGVTIARPAGADEVPEVRERSGFEREGDWLELDPVLVPQLRGLGTVEEGERIELRLGPDTRVLAEGTWWQNEDGRLPAFDLPTLGWNATFRVEHDFGFARLVATGSGGFAESRLGRGHYYDLGIWLRRDIRLSRWMRAWIALGFGRREWWGQPPPGETDATQLMLTLGTTFR